MEDNGTGSPCGSAEESLRKAALSVIDQHALGCPRFWMYPSDVSVYKTADVRVVAVSVTHMWGYERGQRAKSCTLLAAQHCSMLFCPLEQHEFYLRDKRYCISRLVKR